MRDFMEQLSGKTKKLIEYFSVIAAVFLVVLASELLGEKEIIFPEIAALSIGCYLSPKLCWKTSYIRMIVCIEICAVIGVCISAFIPLPLWLQVSLAFVIGQLVFMFSGTSLAPMISAIVLPVLMQTASIVYPVATLILTSYIALKRLALEKAQVKEPNVYEPAATPEKTDWLAFIFRSCLVTVLTFFCVKLNTKFCIAPPLLVAFTELCKPDCPAPKRKPAVILLVALCAVIGAAARFAIVMKCGLPYTLAAIVIGVLIVVLVKTFKLYFPPAGAMAVLALLIPDEAVLTYPIQVCIGISVFVLAAAFWVKRTRKI